MWVHKNYPDKKFEGTYVFVEVEVNGKETKVRKFRLKCDGKMVQYGSSRDAAAAGWRKSGVQVETVVDKGEVFDVEQVEQIPAPEAKKPDVSKPQAKPAGKEESKK